MTDSLAPWANLGMLVVIGGVVTLVLALVAGTGGATTRATPRILGALGAVAAFAAGLVVAAVAVTGPERWWFALLGWAVWIAGEVVVLGLLAGVRAVQRGASACRPA